MHLPISSRRGKLGIAAALLVALLAAAVFMRPHGAQAAACTAPSTDYGTVSNLSVTITSAGTYRIWTRMAAADSSDNTYLLEVDGSSCYTVGGSSVPTYGSGASTYFVNDSSNWISKTSSGTQIDVSLSAGTHTFKMIGNAAGVVVDRIIATQDTGCTPTGTGDNCANPADITQPSVSITSPSNNASISATTTVTAHATDDTAVTKVEFYVDGALKGTDTTADGSSNYTYSLNPSSLSVGPHTLVAKAYDAANNIGTSSTVNFTVPDTTPPVISSVASGSLTQTSATITWTTNEASDSQVNYGTTSSYNKSSPLNSSKVTSHSVTITGLTAGSTYHYQVVSTDAAGNAGASTDKTFTTQAPAADTTPPTVSMTAPSAGATVSGTVTVKASASDNVGVVGVQFKLDGNNLGSEDTTSAYSVSWNTVGVSNGSHTLTAVARDAAGNTKTATSITVNVNNSTVGVADINRDGAVDWHDLSILASNYNKSGSSITNARADMNSDGIVDWHDLSILAANYGK